MKKIVSVVLMLALVLALAAGKRATPTVTAI